MFNSGLATTNVTFESPVETTDANGAPKRSWTPVRVCWAQIENEVVSAQESLQAPYNQNTRSFTLVVRGSPSVPLDTQDRVKATNGSWLGAITGVRYSPRKDIEYIDVVTGASAG